jgi:hypothetical protein
LLLVLRLPCFGWGTLRCKRGHINEGYDVRGKKSREVRGLCVEIRVATHSWFRVLSRLFSLYLTRGAVLSEHQARWHEEGPTFLVQKSGDR